MAIKNGSKWMNFANMNAIIVAINPISPFKTGQNQVNLAISSIVVYMFKGSIVEKVNNVLGIKSIYI